MCRTNAVTDVLNKSAAIDKALRWHPSSTGPKMKQVRKECLDMMKDKPKSVSVSTSRASHYS